jgi:tRNA(Ile)-lysidine synthase
MRAAGGSSWRGLAGMAPITSAPLWPEGRGIVVARPLLNTHREELRVHLRELRIEWIEDPANANVDYERVRARQRLAILAEAGFDSIRLTGLAARLRPRADAIDAGAAVLIRSAVLFRGDRIVIERARWSGALQTRRRALSALIAASAGAQREPQADALGRLEASISNPTFRGATLAGARVQVKRGSIVIDRDRGALEGRADGAQALAPLALPAGIEVVWDGRLALKASADGVIVYADPPAPQLKINQEHSPPIHVESRWLLAERVAHALNVSPSLVMSVVVLTPQNEINVPKP